MIVLLDSENADRDLKTAAITVLTHTPDASNPMLCQVLVKLGDGTKNLDGTGGDFELTITVGGQTIEPSPQTITFSTAVRAAIWSTPFPVPPNNEVVVKVLSPNAADSDVDTTAYLYDVSAQGSIVLNNLDHLISGATPIDGKAWEAALRYIAAAAAGKSSGANTGTETYKGLDGTTSRVEATIDENGNRTAVSYDP